MGRPSNEGASPLVFGLLAIVTALLAARGYGVAAVVIGGLAIVTPLERLRPRRRQRFLRRALNADLMHALVSLPLAFVVGLGPLTLASWLLPPLPTVGEAIASAPVLVQAVIALLLLEFVAYWTHRLQHEVPILWRFHRVHHSSEELDWLAGVRVHPLAALFVKSFEALPLALIGIELSVSAPVAFFALVSGLLTHANVDLRLRPLRRLWVTPDFHHWHHADEPDAIDTNYSGLLPLWDLVFGTYHLPDDRLPERYGIDGGDPATWWGHMKLPFRAQPRSH
ncbi:MAG: sterol desaturase family protein [Planctomycetota bacterium]